MKKNLLIEIKRIQGMMGLVTEGPGPKLMGITADIIQDLMSIVNPRGAGTLLTGARKMLSDDIETLSSIVSGKMKNVPNDEIEKLITRIIRSDEKIAKYLIPQIIKSDIKTINAINKFKKNIELFKSNGGKLDSVLRNIDNNVDNVFRGTPKEITDYIKIDLKKYTDEIYNPNPTRDFAISNLEKLKQGWRMGKDAKSGGMSSMKYLGNKLTNNKISELIDKYFDTEFAKKLSPEEIKTIKKFLWTGVADTPMLQKAHKSLGFPGATGNLSRQLIKKLWFLMKVKFWTNLIIGLTKDLINKGEEITDDEMYEWSKVLYRICKAIEIPSLGWVSPAYWFTGLLLTTGAGAAGGGAQKGWNRFKTYLLGNDEEAVGKWWDGIPLGEFLAGFVVKLDNLVRDFNTDIKETQQGEIEGTPYILPNDIKKDTANNVMPVNTDTAAIKTLFMNHLKTIPDLNQGGSKGKIGPKDQDFMFSMGNNVWEFELADTNKTRMKFIYNPINKTFTKVN